MNREQFLLMKLAEECAEVSQRAIKQIQFGADQIQKAGEVAGGQGPAPKEVGLSNAQRLQDEITDLEIIISLLAEANQLTLKTDGPFSDLRAKKVEKLNKYLAFARSLGQLPGEWTV